MTTKTDFLGQHTPLHRIYGENDCCLCRLELENAQLRLSLDQARKVIAPFAKRLTETRYPADAIRAAEWLEAHPEVAK
jgi:hypothetical protein